ncbi:2-hydroxyacid dehydrogenase [Secundilactobacillus paracollinoides]|uniref:Hydroxyacid dehydrogenase n=1 Tax=Secundilactobacillus paracollinoides TaxID=240427 RepID=A0A1B2IWS5_9LACO|nr:NAD(P)-dependent oxidoreductase [Secundilactobacillus paracollinoides]ANZ60639.1 hydroxyacid dehydrogenase [Secundilactobacillus paracollinoides]ANZ66482.1 hydroxyacid dehydrogenase [Secundilactobacillus paracollinoides]
MPKIVILNGAVVNYDNQINRQMLPGDIVVYDTTPEDKILDWVTGATVVVTKEMPMPGDILRQFPTSVKMVCEAGTGYNNYDAEALQEKGIMLTNIPAYSTQRVAQTAIMLMLNLASTMQEQIRMLATGNHDNFDKHLMVNHVELNGKTLGVVGFGHIGQAIIKVAQAMQMKILVATRTPRDDRDGIHFTTQAELFATSDVVSLNLPLTEATHHMVNERLLKTMKPTAFLINTARGGLIDQDVLITALQQHEIAGAGLDVQEVEPLPDDSPLFQLPNVIVTPHIGWRGLETRQRLLQIINDNVTAFLDGKPINRVI